MIFSFIILLLPLNVYAYPISVLNSSSSAAAFAGLLAVALSVTILVAAKLLYMRYRRIHVSYNISDCSLQSSHRSATSFFFNSEKLAKPGKAAFFVGLFGSPSWETSTKKLYDDSPTIYSNQLQFQSRRSQNRTSFSISEFGGLGRNTRHYSNNSETCESRAFSNTLVAGSRPPPSYASVPSYPANARTNSSSRRHSLPVTRQVNPDRRKRHSSLKSSKTRRSDSLSAPGLRIVESTKTTSPDTLLPLSPKIHTSFLDFEQTSPNSSSTHLRTQSKSNRSVVPPLPPLPASVVLSPLPGLAPIEGRSYISTPYALSPKIKQTSPSSDTYVNTDLQDQVFDTASRYISQSSASRTKPKPSRSPSVRSRKSPVIGPSPLRTMTLPVPSQASLDKIAHKENLPTVPTAQVNPNNEPIDRRYADLGIGYPSSWGLGLQGGSEISQREFATEEELTSRFARRRVSHTTSSAPGSGYMAQRVVSDCIESLPSQLEVDDMDAMLGIIQELVEETSQWDDSLFMDDSFKALIQHSRSTSGSESALAQSKSSKSSHHSSIPVDEDIPDIPSPPSRTSADSARPRSASSIKSAKSKIVSSEDIGTPNGERKPSPKSILKKPTMVASRSVEFDLGLVELDAVRMESFRMSAYGDPVLYEDVMPGAYEHGMLLAPLQEEQEEDQQVQAQI